MVPRVDWAVLKERLNRTPALSVQLSDRRSIRSALKLLDDHYPAARQHADLVPVSTMQWSSDVLGRNGHNIAFVDIEQANALSLLLSRGFWHEKPIFSYTEFMIRAAEAFYDDGDIPLAVSASECANLRLREYCRHQKSGAVIPRPKAFDPALINVMEAKIILSFITGHELGHLFQLNENFDVKPLFDWDPRPAHKPVGN